jgi:Txe/YoeB family toxin of Txe-Axe toxin-antitoxin module
MLPKDEKFWKDNENLCLDFFNSVLEEKCTETLQIQRQIEQLKKEINTHINRLFAQLTIHYIIT